MRLGSILIPTDFSCGSRATAGYAAALARHFGAKLTMLHVLPPINLGLTSYAIAEEPGLLGELERIYQEATGRSIEREARQLGVSAGGIVIYIQLFDHEKPYASIYFGNHCFKIAHRTPARNAGHWVGPSAPFLAYSDRYPKLVSSRL